jgi:uncharacterized membrane protein
MKVVGSTIAVLGLIILALGFLKDKITITFLDSYSQTLLSVIGVVLVVLGVVFSLMKNNLKKQVTEEVPIYDGDKVVGYRRQG